MSGVTTESFPQVSDTLESLCHVLVFVTESWKQTHFIYLLSLGPVHSQISHNTHFLSFSERERAREGGVILEVVEEVQSVVQGKFGKVRNALISSPTCGIGVPFEVHFVRFFFAGQKNVFFFSFFLIFFSVKVLFLYKTFVGVFLVLEWVIGFPWNLF